MYHAVSNHHVMSLIAATHSQAMGVHLDEVYHGQCCSALNGHGALQRRWRKDVLMGPESSIDFLHGFYMIHPDSTWNL